MIAIKELCKKFGADVVLQDIQFTIKKGNISILYGRNGAGKTTLIKCLIGLLKIDKGVVDFNFVDFNEIGVVLEDSMLINKLTVFEYLEFICVLKKLNKKEYYNEIDELIKYMDLSSEKNKFIDKLSKGTKSKLKLISAIIFNPKILLLDEPFLGMDIIAIENTIDLLNRQAEKGCITLISTHNLDIIKDVNADLLILKNNTISDRITNTQIRANKNNLKKFLLDKI